MPTLDDLLAPSSRTRKRRKSVSTDLAGSATSGESEESLLRGLGRKAVGGVAALGNLIDLPDSMFRDVVGLASGKSWAEANPFDQILSPFSSENRLSGRDLTTQWGLTKANDPNKWEAADFGGFGVELGLSPLGWLAAPLKATGALSKGGQVLKRAGLLDDFTRSASRGVSSAGGKAARLGTLAEGVGARKALMTHTVGDLLTSPEALHKAGEAAAGMGLRLDDIRGEKLGGLFGISAPFKAEPFVTFGTGELSQKIAHGLDVAGDKLRYSKPGRMLAATFSKAAGGAPTRFGQEHFAESAARNASGVAGVRASIAPHIKAFKEAGVFDDPELARLTRRALENVGPRGNPLETELLQTDGLSNIPVDKQAYLGWHIQQMKSKLDHQHVREKAAGLSGPDLNDVLDKYFPRSPNRLAMPTKGFDYGSRAVPTTHGSQKARSNTLKGFFGGTDTLNSLTMDGNFSGIASKMTADNFTDAFVKGKADELRQALIAAGEPASLIDDDLTGVVRWLADLDPQYADNGIGFFDTNPMDDFARRMEMGERAIEGATLAKTMLIDGATSPGAVSASGQSGFQTMAEVIEKLKLNDEAKAEIANALGKSVDDLKSVRVRPEVAGDVERVMKPFIAPDEVAEWIKPLDKLTNWFRNNVTTPFPSFHGRNLISGQFQNMMIGAFSFRSLRATDDIVRGRSSKLATKIRGFSQNVDQATEQLRQEAFAQGFIGGHHGQSLDIQNPTSTNLGSQYPGLEPRSSSMVASLKGGLSDLLPNRSKGVPSAFQQYMPWNVKGAAAEEDLFRPAIVGQNVAAYTEELNRLAPYIELRVQGYAPDEAARMVKSAQVDYSNLSRFEQKVGKRVLPFYAYSRGMAEFVANELMRRPGGRLGASIRASGKTTDDDPGLPEYVAQGAAIPVTGGPLEALLGAPPEGTSRYISGTGLPFEDLAGFAGGGVQGALQELASRSNPLIKAPIEWLTGESLFQRGPSGGRDLTDLDPTLGRLVSNVGESVFGAAPNNLPSGRARPLFGSPALEFVVANSPFARATTTARTVFDPRKDYRSKLLSQLTGLRITDVSEQSRDAVLQEFVNRQQLESGARTYQNTYYPKDSVLDADQLTLQRLDDLLSQRAKARAKARRLDRQPPTAIAARLASDR